MPQTSGLGHVGIYVNDIHKMREFYTKVIGLKIGDEDLDGDEFVGVSDLLIVIDAWGMCI